MQPSVEQLENLLALRRDERPEEGYWQDFLCEFHHRQRQQTAERSGFSGFMERISSWVSDLGPSKWAYGAGLAYATATVAFFLIPREVQVENTPASPVSYQVVPAPAPTVEQLDQLDLSRPSQGNAGEKVYY